MYILIYGSIFLRQVRSSKRQVEAPDRSRKEDQQ